jgi:hypothetical protein
LTFVLDAGGVVKQRLKASNHVLGREEIVLEEASTYNRPGFIIEILDNHNKKRLAG